MRLFKMVLSCLLFVLPQLLHAQVDYSHNNQKSVCDFVQSFYEWYVPKALHSESGPAWDVAIREKEDVFSAELALKLREDLEAQAKIQDLIVGLDFDPFLNSQDPSSHYIVGRVTRNGENYLVDVHVGVPGKMGKKPVVTAEVRQLNGRWQFVNFHYLDGHDLLSVLNALKQDREKAAS